MPLGEQCGNAVPGHVSARVAVQEHHGRARPAVPNPQRHFPYVMPG
jgi:hypothetical protein